MSQLHTVEGQLRADGLRFALVAGRFNEFIVSGLISGAEDFLVRHGASREEMTLVRVPGSFEMPVVVKKLLEKGEYHGIVCLGAIIRGATPHFEYVASEVTKGLANLSIQYSVPLGFGIVTADTLEQAIERAGSKAGNKGADAAHAALETAQVLAGMDG